MPDDAQSAQAAPEQNTPASEPRTFDESYVKELRTEAASWRKQVRELQSQLEQLTGAAAQAKQAELEQQNQFKPLYEQTRQQLEQLQAELAAQKRAAVVSKVARDFGLPDALAERLRGDDEDALRADAEALRVSLGLNQQQQTAGAGRPQTTTAVPGGQPVSTTEEQIKSWLYGRQQGNSSSPTANGSTYRKFGG